jgi:hypothetical protein
MKISRKKLKKIVKEETKVFILNRTSVIAEQDGRRTASTKKVLKGKAAAEQEKIRQGIIKQEKERIQKTLAMGYLKSLHSYFIKNFYNKKLNEQFDAGITFSTLLTFKDKFDLSKYLPSKEDLGEIQKVENSLKDILNNFFSEADNVKNAIAKNKNTNPEKWGNYDKVAIKAIDEYVKKVYNLAIAAKKIMDRIKKIAELTKIETAIGEDIWKNYKKASDELTRGKFGEKLLDDILQKAAAEDQVS